MKAAIYSRFSKERENEASIEDQLRVCREFAKRERLHVTQLYEDRGISGEALGNRPGVIKMQQAALAGEFDVLLAMDLSRLSRTNRDLADLSDTLVDAGVRIIGIHDGADTARDGWEVQFGLAGIIGQQVRKQASVKSYESGKSRALAGKPTGGKAYGYASDKEAEVVRGIYRRYAEGAGLKTIASELNARGIPSPGSSWKRETRRANGWMNSAVRVILRNPLYIGEIIWGRYKFKRHKKLGTRRRVELPESQWIRHHDSRKRIIDQKLWDRVQRRIKATQSAETGKSKRGRGIARHVLSGLLICGDCGANFILVDSRAYGCSSAHGGGACDNKLRIKRETIEDAILNPLKKKLLAPEQIKKAVAEMQRYYRQRVRASSEEAKEAPREVKELDAQIARLRQRKDKDLSAAEIQMIIERKEARRKELLEMQKPIARKRGDSVIAMIPRAAQLYRDEVNAGLSGDDPEAVAKARVALRELVGPVKLERGPEPGSLYAVFKMNRLALLGRHGARVNGSGGRI